MTNCPVFKTIPFLMLTISLAAFAVTTNAQTDSDPNAVKGAAAIPPGQELVNIDFPEPTEITDIIKAVALWTGKNVILDRNVKGKVQIISPKKVTKEEAYQAFLSALNLINLTTVETGKVIKIQQIRTAVKGNLKTFLGSSWTPLTDEIITQIVPLKYIDAKGVKTTLSRIVNSKSLIAYPPTNTLIISDSGYNVARILNIIRLMDVEGQQPQVAIVPIRFADAKVIAQKVTEIFSASSKGKGSSSRTYKILTDERTNSVIIFGPPRTIGDVKKLVKKFDVTIDDPTRQSTIHVRPLDFADAKKMSATLSALISGKSKTSGFSRSSPRSTRKGGSKSSPSTSDISDEVKITADETSNSLLITGSRTSYRALNTIIRKLDQRRRQVFVEADILDINLDNRFNFNSAIFAGRRGPKNSKIATTWEAKPLGPLVASQVIGDAGGATQAKEVAGIFEEDMTLGIISGTTVDIPGLGKVSPGAIIKLLKADGNTRVLASPHLLTSNNEESQITVGEKLFFRSQEMGMTGTVINKVEKEEVDLTLNIKPNVSHANYVTMKIELESSAADLDAQTGLPKINKRKTTQTVVVKNGQTVVISGLVQTQEFERYRKIPFLGDLPILGWLFRNSQLASLRKNLAIFLTPHIIDGANDLTAIYKDKVRQQKEFLKLVFGTEVKEENFLKNLRKI